MQKFCKSPESSDFKLHYLTLSPVHPEGHMSICVASPGKLSGIGPTIPAVRVAFLGASSARKSHIPTAVWPCCAPFCCFSRRCFRASDPRASYIRNKGQKGDLVRVRASCSHYSCTSCLCLVVFPRSKLNFFYPPWPEIARTRLLFPFMHLLPSCFLLHSGEQRNSLNIQSEHRASNFQAPQLWFHVLGNWKNFKERDMVGVGTRGSSRH